MEKYDKYKDSGIDLLGEIPENWNTKKLKYLLEEKLKYGANESALFDNPEDPRYIRITDFGDDGKLKEDTFKSLPLSVAKEYLLNDGDILFARSGATVGKTFQFKNYDGKACFAGYLIKASLDNKKTISDFLYLFTKSSYYTRWKESIFNQATIQNIGADKYSFLDIPIPPLEEQKTIARFLDRKTAEIDKLIAQKERLIELYEEEKTAIINQAVTKGINPDVKLKPSGIDWLGDIPENWEVKKLKHLVTKIGSGITPKGGADVYQLEGIPLLRSQNVYFDGLRLDDVAYISEQIHHEMSNSQVFSGDVLLNITGGSIGRCFYVDDKLGEANVNQHVCIVRPGLNISTRFLYYVLSSNLGQKQIDVEQTGSGREGLNFESLKNFLLPCITLKEQKAIAHYIETECDRINAKIAKTKKIIELQKEYRTALISEAVTGKIKVPQLP